MIDPRVTPDSDTPAADWRDHPEGCEDGFFEEWDSEPDSGGYSEEEMF